MQSKLSNYQRSLGTEIGKMVKDFQEIFREFFQKFWRGIFKLENKALFKKSLY